MLPQRTARAARNFSWYVPPPSSLDRPSTLEQVVWSPSWSTEREWSDGLWIELLLDLNYMMQWTTNVLYVMQVNTHQVMAYHRRGDPVEEDMVFHRMSETQLDPDIWKTWEKPWEIET